MLMTVLMEILQLQIRLTVISQVQRSAKGKQKPQHFSLKPWIRLLQGLHCLLILHIMKFSLNYGHFKSSSNMYIMFGISVFFKGNVFISLMVYEIIKKKNGAHSVKLKFLLFSQVQYLSHLSAQFVNRNIRVGLLWAAHTCPQ